jgi:flagellar hook-length control protein FliK
VDSRDDKGSEILTTPAVATDPKASVQAQSAAALLAPQVQQSKAPTAEAKVTTEELLKQLQTAGVTAQAEQGSSSSSGESSQHGSTEALLSAIEPQKTSAAVVAETNSFSSQLKSTLDKISSGISVSGRELVSEASQKQADQLGQKLNLIQPEASNQLKEKMLMMVKDKVHTAEIRLDPSELGSMQIKISLQQDQMSVQFMVQQGNAKELMEQQMPKLKELLQQQGIELSQGSVQQQNQSSSGQDGGRRTAGGTGSGNGQALSEELTEPVVLPTKTSDRVVDYYA